jgi:hypothetical protein
MLRRGCVDPIMGEDAREEDEEIEKNQAINQRN